jgi:hypothetical protein
MHVLEVALHADHALPPNDLHEGSMRRE